MVIGRGDLGLLASPQMSRDHQWPTVAFTAIITPGIICVSVDCSRCQIKRQMMNSISRSGLAEVSTSTNSILQTYTIKDITFVVELTPLPVAQTSQAFSFKSSHVVNSFLFQAIYESAATRVISIWRHQMETFAALLATCAGNSPVLGEFLAQRSVTRSFGVFVDLRPNKRLVWNGEAGDLRRHRAHYDVIVMLKKLLSGSWSSICRWR